MKLAGLITVLVALATAPAAGAATMTPTSHDFGDVNVGTSSPPLTFTFTNGCTTMAGAACVTPEVSRLTPSVTPSSDYSLVNSCPSELSTPGQSCTFTVTFKPSATGVRSGIVNTGAIPMASLRGTGVSSQPVGGKKKCKKKKRAAAAKKCKKKK
jgi:hypothetical protein